MQFDWKHLVREASISGSIILFFTEVSVVEVPGEIADSADTY